MRAIRERFCMPCEVYIGTIGQYGRIVIGESCDEFDNLERLIWHK